MTNGKTLLLELLFGLSSELTPATIVNSLGVGSSNTASSTSDTQLQGTSLLIQGLDAGYPSISNQTVTCQSTFGTSVANFTWAETGLFNGTTNGTSVMFNRIAPIGPFTKSSAVSIVVIITITQS